MNEKAYEEAKEYLGKLDQLHADGKDSMIHDLCAEVERNRDQLQRISDLGKRSPKHDPLAIIGEALVIAREKGTRLVTNLDDEHLFYRALYDGGVKVLHSDISYVEKARIVLEGLKDKEPEETTDNSVYMMAVDRLGQDVQLDMLIEEMLEAIDAIVEFKDEGAAEETKKRAKKAGLPVGLEGLQEFIDKSGLTVANFLKVQVRGMKAVMKRVRKNKGSIYNEIFDIGQAMVASMVAQENEDEIEDPLEHLADELADVEIMIAQARHGMGLAGLIDKHKKLKVARLKKRLEKED